MMPDISLRLESIADGPHTDHDKVVFMLRAAREHEKLAASEITRLRRELDEARAVHDVDQKAFLAMFRRAEKAERELASLKKPVVSGEMVEPSALAKLKTRIDYRMNAYLIDMKPDYDDSITGFNEAWGIIDKIFADAGLSQRASDLPDDDEPKTWRDLAEAAIMDLRRYAHDELPDRRLVSADAYDERFELLSALDPQPEAALSSLPAKAGAGEAAARTIEACAEIADKFNTAEAARDPESVWQSAQAAAGAKIAAAIRTLSPLKEQECEGGAE